MVLDKIKRLLLRIEKDVGTYEKLQKSGEKITTELEYIINNLANIELHAIEDLSIIERNLEKLINIIRSGSVNGRTIYYVLEDLTSRVYALHKIKEEIEKYYEQLNKVHNTFSGEIKEITENHQKLLNELKELSEEISKELKKFSGELLQNETFNKVLINEQSISKLVLSKEYEDYREEIAILHELNDYINKLSDILHKIKSIDENLYMFVKETNRKLSYGIANAYQMLYNERNEIARVISELKQHITEARDLLSKLKHLFKDEKELIGEFEKYKRILEEVLHKISELQNEFSFMINALRKSTKLLKREEVDIEKEKRIIHDLIRNYESIMEYRGSEEKPHQLEAIESLNKKLENEERTILKIYKEIERELEELERISYKYHNNKLGRFFLEHLKFIKSLYGGLINSYNQYFEYYKHWHSEFGKPKREVGGISIERIIRVLEYILKELDKLEKELQEVEKREKVILNTIAMVE